jgi:hypothetical protein
MFAVATDQQSQRISISLDSMSDISAIFGFRFAVHMSSPRSS